MEFLRDHLPCSDLDCYPFPFFLRFADHALALRDEAPWCGELEWEIFAHYVLFPRVNDEDLSFHRALFHRELWPRVKDLATAGERVLEVNRWCCEHASYQAQDERTASPLTVYRCGSGRCGVGLPGVRPAQRGRRRPAGIRPPLGPLRRQPRLGGSAVRWTVAVFGGL